ncbi:MAG: hypothetical protein J3Q66DRAFT_350199 [Benniella sp.]|nr:MAG: hypothetical protein J3Q66DRAFT_350199 [Benniella sp.]
MVVVMVMVMVMVVAIKMELLPPAGNSMAPGSRGKRCWRHTHSDHTIVLSPSLNIAVATARKSDHTHLFLHHTSRAH